MVRSLIRLSLTLAATAYLTGAVARADTAAEKAGNAMESSGNDSEKSGVKAAGCLDHRSLPTRSLS